eukprot:c20676_g1_i1 orf=546-1601(+)
MQGIWGWGGMDKPHPSVAECWQGQWESHGRGESTGWDAGNWDQLDENIHYEEFENVMRWDDSGALEAFEISKKLNEGCSRGLTSSPSLPSPDLYIQPIDWDNHEDLKLPELGEAVSSHGEKTGQRKRGRKGGGVFRRQFDRQDLSIAADWNQSRKPFSQPVCYSEEQVQPGQDPQTLYDGSSKAPLLDGRLDSSQRDGLRYQWQSPFYDRTKNDWSTRCSSQPYQTKKFVSSNWQDQGRSNWDEHHNLQPHQSHDRWQQTNVSSEQARGLGHGGIQHESSHGLLNDHHYQAMPTAHGGGWMSQGGENGRGFAHQSMVQFNRGLKQHHVTSYVPDKTRRWRQQQQLPNHRWQ